jgi:hypothetical protein
MSIVTTYLRADTAETLMADLMELGLCRMEDGKPAFGDPAHVVDWMPHLSANGLPRFVQVIEEQTSNVLQWYRTCSVTAEDDEGNSITRTWEELDGEMRLEWQEERAITESVEDPETGEMVDQPTGETETVTCSVSDSAIQAEQNRILDRLAGPALDQEEDPQGYEIWEGLRGDIQDQLETRTVSRVYRTGHLVQSQVWGSDDLGPHANVYAQSAVATPGTTLPNGTEVLPAPSTPLRRIAE